MTTPAVLVVQAELAPHATFGMHQHPVHLLTWSMTATVAVHTGDREWLVPPSHALWMPARTAHAVTGVRTGLGYAVAIGTEDCPVTWSEPTAVLVTPLLRELIVHLDGHPEPGPERAAAERLLMLLLRPASSAAFHVPMPADPRTREIADALVADPADPRDLDAWARHVSAGVRTVTRLFRQETGMTFAQWRTHVRVRAALTLLADGTPVATTARAVGYRKPGAFAEAFRRVTGAPPGAYLPSAG